jgi:hypothetical protein
MQGMKEEFNIDVQILKKNQFKNLEMKTNAQYIQIKTQLKALPINWVHLKTDCWALRQGR